MTATARKAFQVLGATDDVTTCELCGRDDLRSTIALAVLDVDGNDTGERVHYGSDCGAKAAGWTVAEINRRVRDARKAQLDADEKTRAAYADRRFEALVTWAGETLGITNRKALRDFGIFKQFCESDAYTAFQAAENSDQTAPAPAANIATVQMSQPTDRPRKGANRPALTGRAARRHAARAQARTEQRPGFPVIGHHERAIIANANAGHHLVRDFLQSIGFADWERYESAAGRRIAQTYRDNHGTDPDRGGKVILHGRVWSTMRYDNVLDLIAGAQAYKRTAHLVAVPAAVEVTIETVQDETAADNPQNIQAGDRVRLAISECPDEVAATVVRVYRDTIGILVADVQIQSGDVRPQNIEFLTRVGGPVPAAV